MAEIAIMLVALGSMYVVSNQNKSQAQNIQENFSNVGLSNLALNGEPTVPVSNYPVLKDVSKTSNVSYYPNPNQATDKYYDESLYQKTATQGAGFGVGGGTQKTYSLSGKPVDKASFSHNNMVPFFGGKVKGATVDMNVAESILDNMQGSGSQLIRKQEQAPMFQPHQNLQFANGAPNMSEFMQSRVNPSMRMANVKPWEEQMVGPGLNQGYTTEGSAGFNAGMEARDSWLPKTVNELRVDTNPKMTFGLSGHEGPATAYVKDYADTRMQGKVEKYMPDTYYTVGPDRWFTTTGLEKAQTARSEEMLNDVNRTSTSAEYFGAGQAEGGQAPYIKGEYQMTRRPCLEPNDITNARAVGMALPTVADHGALSYTNLHNNRSTTRSTDYSAVSGVMKAVVSPLLDILRPSRKENFIGNARPNGNAGTVVSNSRVYNPADRTKTTIKEMTEGQLDCNHLNIEKQSGNAYLVSKHQPVSENRDTTTVNYNGNAGPNSYVASKSYDAEYMQHNNVNKTYPNRPNHGGNQIFNQNENISIHRRDNDRDNTRMWVPNASQMSSTPAKEMYGIVSGPQYLNEDQCARNSPDILTAFKNNPYTQSLSSWA
jgi:hypothetical protein